jgi:very-short-patch-repair endonuclease
MRSDPVKAERLLWAHLRDRKLAGLKFKRQKAIGAFIADFFCAESKLIVELDGDSHEGRETYDECRTEWLEKEGHRVLRFSNEDEFSNLEGVLREIMRACAIDPDGRGR